MNDGDGGPETQPFGVLPSRRRDDTEDDRRVDPEDVLDRLDGLDVRVWRYPDEGASGVERLGPAAEDFYEAFEVGEDPDRIAAGDADGVALAAIQGLADRVDEQHARIERQQAVIDEQRADLETLRKRLETLQAAVARLRGGSEHD